MMRWERLCQHAGLKHVWKVYTTGSDPALKQTGIQRGKIKANNKKKKLSHTTVYISASCLNYPLCSVMYGRSGNSYWYGFKNTAEWKSLFSNLIVRCVCVTATWHMSVALLCLFHFWTRTALNNELPPFSSYWAITALFPKSSIHLHNEVSNSLSLSNPVMCVSQSFMWWQRPVVVCHLL